MKKRLLKLIIPSIIVVSFFGWEWWQGKNVLGANVQAVGDLIITYLGVPLGDPIFEVTGMLPGDCTDVHTVVAENTGPNSVAVAVKSDNETENPLGFAERLNLTISQDATELFNGTLASFFTASDAPDGVFLSTVGSTETVNYDFVVCFVPGEDDNQWQGAETIFDLVFGSEEGELDLPDECFPIAGFITEVIEGTEGDDILRGTSAHEFILGKGGNDRIIAASGHDCVVGGEGDDRIELDSGNDVGIGGPGEDRLSGGNGNDVMHGGGGNDRMNGNSGNDKIFGEGGNDGLGGDSGNDLLDGGDDTDRLRGNSGVDKCVDGEDVGGCEL
ncbi:MAG: hypothetical protein HYS86_01005 [Candidatus Chisholmbacteria bacterium]|nr:hypothetical protein [Candidatus Chisholmbacteria bacterium]